MATATKTKTDLPPLDAPKAGRLNIQYTPDATTEIAENRIA